MIALYRDGVEFSIVYGDVGVLRVLVAAALVWTIDYFAGDVIDQLLAQPIAGFLVDLAERDPFGRCGASVKGDRTRNERELIRGKNR
jgi:hypothetical protein